MRMSSGWGWLAGGMVWALAAAVLAADATFQVDANSDYVWRGITLHDGFVVQPSLDVGLLEGLGAYVWGNVNGSDDGDDESGDFSEVDLCLYYEREVSERLTLSAGHLEYLFPGRSGPQGGPQPGTREFYGRGGIELGAGFSTILSGFYDWDEADGGYGNAALMYTLKLGEALLVDATGAVGAADRHWAASRSGGTDGGWHDYCLTLGSSYRIRETLEVGAAVSYTDRLDKDVLPEADVNLYGGVSLACQF